MNLLGGGDVILCYCYLNSQKVNMRTSLSLLAVSLVGGVALPRGEWNGEIKGLPSTQLPQVPLLGNGYTGIAMDYRRRELIPRIGPGREEAVDFWVNTNAMWTCANSTSPHPPRCKRISFAGYSVRPQFDSEISFSALEDISIATLFTTQNSSSGSFNTKTVMHPNEKGSFFTELSYTGITSCINATVSLWVTSEKTGGAVPDVGFEDSSLHVSRRTNTRDELPFAVWTSLAASLSVPYVSKPTIRKTEYQEVSAIVQVCPGKPVVLLLGIADNFNNKSNVVTNSLNPLQEAITATKNTTVEDIQIASNTFWKTYWNKASIDTPDFPNINKGWYFTQYFTHCALGRLGSPPSGMYGPWTSSDSSKWHGDYTLDYNQEAQFYGIFSSNRVDQFSSYSSPIFDWEPSARLLAQEEAAAANITCPSNTLHYACHLAPWGYQSEDGSVYMHWNGMFAALPLISYWEYTRDSLKGKTYDMLDGLNSWSHCYLKDINNQLVDYNRENPDEEHERQKVKNPQIGLSLIRRTAQAQLTMAAYYNKKAPEYLTDILNRLTPYNNNSKIWTSFDGASEKESDDFSMYPMWPTQAIEIIEHPAVRNMARQSAKKYCNLATGRPVLVFSAAVRAGSDDEEGLFSKLDIINAFESYYKTNGGPSGLPTAPYGGTENVGVLAGLNDVFLQSPEVKFIEVFPMWPLNLTASFKNLRAKGGYSVSSGIHEKYIKNITIVASVDNTPTVLLPWVNATIRCDGIITNYTRVTPRGARGRVGAFFIAPLNSLCVVSEK